MIQMRLHVAVMVTRQLAGAGIGILLTVFLARTLSVNDNGVYASLSLIPLLAASLFGLGVGPASIYYTSSKAYSFDDVLISNICLSVVCSVCAMFALGGLVYWDLVPSALAPHQRAMTLAVCATFPLLLFTNGIAALQGIQRFRAFSLFSILPPVLLLLAVVAIHALSRRGVMVDSAITALLASYVASSVIVLVYFRRTLSVVPNAHMSRYYSCMVSLLKFGSRAHIANVLALLNYRLNYYIILSLEGSASLGLFAVTASICEALWILSSATAAVVFPLAAARSGEANDSSPGTLSAARWVFYLTTAAASVTVLAIRPLAELMFGHQYSSIPVLVYILMPGVLCTAFARVLANEIAGRGKPSVNAKIAGVAFLINTVLNFALIPAIGLPGAAVAASVSYAALAALTVRAFSIITGLRVKEIITPRVQDLHTAQRLLRFPGIFSR
jgi:O-antigen/teichoic acid export membrane protein